MNTVKGASDFEKSTLTQVTEARNLAQSTQIDISKATPEQMKQYNDAQSGLTSSLSRLIAVAEAYPELRATESYRDLMSQLEGTENRIQVARSDYNNVARPYNTKIQTFSTNIVASLFGFDRQQYFESDNGTDKAPKVDFGTN